MEWWVDEWAVGWMGVWKDEWIPLLRLCQQGYICIFANKTILID